MIGRRRPDPGREPSSAIHIGGDSIAPIQNVVGREIRGVHQSASVRNTAGPQDVRDLLTTFRAELDRHQQDLATAPVLRGMAETIDAQLTASPPDEGVLSQLARALPALVAGTAVQEGGQALADAITGWIG
ncbi:hypothetical protein [Streptomyces sp. col6]|uniref:hypothetical protein n=1 Tax=Streptomyces sp. col6 TaxID=2478958 RepID=UPI001CD1777A|nr:hypothetical protein [Streptomyces sp. col6]